MRSKTILLAAVGAALMFPGLSEDSEAQLFKRRRAKTSTTNCPPGSDCYRGGGNPYTTPQLTGGGGLTVNRKGGFEGQLPDSYYARYAGQPTATAPTVAVAAVPAAPTVARVPTLAAVPTKVPPLAKKAGKLTLSEAEQALLDAQSQLEAARLAFEKATSEQLEKAAIATVEKETAEKLRKLEAIKQARIAAVELDAKIRSQQSERDAEQRKLEQLKALQLSLQSDAAAAETPGPTLATE